MNELREWFLIMLTLHMRAVPSARGGGVTFYVEMFDVFTGLQDEYEHERRACAQVITLYQRVEALNRNLEPRTVREAFSSITPPLITERGHGRGYPALFRLTDSGKLLGDQLVADLSESCITTLMSAIRDRHPPVQPRRNKAK